MSLWTTQAPQRLSLRGRHSCLIESGHVSGPVKVLSRQCREGGGGGSGQANASNHAGWSGQENGRTRMHSPVRTEPPRLDNAAVASKALVLNRARFGLAARVRAFRLGKPVFVLLKLLSVQPKETFVVRPELSGLRGKHNTRKGYCELGERRTRIGQKQTHR
jgi:hypothetical protein